MRKRRDMSASCGPARFIIWFRLQMSRLLQGGEKCARRTRLGNAADAPLFLGGPSLTRPDICPGEFALSSEARCPLPGCYSDARQILRTT